MNYEPYIMKILEDGSSLVTVWGLTKVATLVPNELSGAHKENLLEIAKLTSKVSKLLGVTE